MASLVREHDPIHCHWSKWRCSPPHPSLTWDHCTDAVAGINKHCLPGILARKNQNWQPNPCGLDLPGTSPLPVSARIRCPRDFPNGDSQLHAHTKSGEHKQGVHLWKITSACSAPEMQWRGGWNPTVGRVHWRGVALGAVLGRALWTAQVYRHNKAFCPSFLWLSVWLASSERQVKRRWIVVCCFTL